MLKYSAITKYARKLKSFSVLAEQKHILNLMVSCSLVVMFCHEAEAESNKRGYDDVEDDNEDESDLKRSRVASLIEDSALASGSDNDEESEEADPAYLAELEVCIYLVFETYILII